MSLRRKSLAVLTALLLLAPHATAQTAPESCTDRVHRELNECLLESVIMWQRAECETEAALGYYQCLWWAVLGAYIAAATVL